MSLPPPPKNAHGSSDRVCWGVATASRSPLAGIFMQGGVLTRGGVCSAAAVPERSARTNMADRMARCSVRVRDMQTASTRERSRKVDVCVNGRHEIPPPRRRPARGVNNIRGGCEIRSSLSEGSKRRKDEKGYEYSMEKGRERTKYIKEKGKRKDGKEEKVVGEGGGGGRNRSCQ